jgi:hypothetical protein
VRAVFWLMIAAVLVSIAPLKLMAQSPARLDATIEPGHLFEPAEVQITQPNLPTFEDVITVRATFGQTWFGEDKTGKQYQVYLLRGQCHVSQGDSWMSCQQLVVWKSQHANHDRFVVFANGGVDVEHGLQRSHKAMDLVQLDTTAGFKIDVPRLLEEEPPTTDPLLLTAYTAVERQGLQLTQHLVPPVPDQLSQAQPQMMAPPMAPIPDPSSQAPVQLLQPDAGVRSVVISPRSSEPLNWRSSPSDNTFPPEQITVITGGVNVLVRGIDQINGMNQLGEIEAYQGSTSGGVLDLTADKVVIWTQMDESGNFSPEMFQGTNVPLQVYLEGNIEVRQGMNLIKAQQAFFDIREERALLINSELQAYIPELQGSVRVRADRIRQLNNEKFHAQNAWVTASQFGKPTYRLQASDIFFENRYDLPWLGEDDFQIDPATGKVKPRAVPWVTSTNNTLFLNDLPVFYTPYLTGPAEDPQIPIRELSFAQDRIFGTQLRSTWNFAKLMGVDLAPGTTWDLNLDFLSDRGPGIGTEVVYEGQDVFDVPGPYYGQFDAYYIHDDGLDNLGLNRRDLVPKDSNRGKVLWRHRQALAPDTTLVGELGFLSDRNFLEQYYENEFDTGKDYDTRLELAHQFDNLNLSIWGRYNLNDFDYQTDWLPKAEATLLGEPLLNDWLNYSQHSSVGYGIIGAIEGPTDPDDVFTPLPYFPQADGVVAQSRHELSLPFNLGPVKVVPYVLGEAAFWQDDGFTGNDIDRYYGQAGVRSSIMFHKLFPGVQSDILGLNGLAHKHELGMEYYYAEASRGLESIPQYNEFDDNSQERFRERMLVNTFGGALPLIPGYATSPFDPRYFAVRNNAGSSVTSPYFELVDDQHVVRATSRHRLQTKVGPPEDQQIIDWMTLDLGISYFLNADRDNYGEDIGVVDAHYTWDVGSRTKLLANAYLDFFESAPQMWDVGILSQRSLRGSMYLGYRQIEAGPVESRLINFSTSYAMSQKWIATFGTSYDVAEMQDRGQSLTVSRLGQDFIFHVGANVDTSKDNVGVIFSIEPRFGAFNSSNTQLSSLLGIR